MESGQIFVLFLVIIVFAGGALKHHLRTQSSQPHEDPENRNRIAALEQRVQTLERIVTDKGYDLKREFDQL